MPKVSDAHREARREQIAAAALACFAEKGFQRTSMADIIEASGLSAGAIYLHFESKQQIALAVGRRVLGRRLGDLEGMAGDRLADPVTTLEHLLSGMVHDILDTRLLIQLWSESMTDPELSALVTEIFATLRGALTGYLTAWAEHRGAADPGAWAATALPAVLALAQGFMVQRALLPGFDAEGYFVAARAVAGPGLLIPAP
jgi:TetR/AcrR family transcriptional regulator, transcriptional repressor of aconitase